MAKLVEELNLVREPGYLYYVDEDGDVCRCAFNYPRKLNTPEPKPERLYKTGIRREPGYLYFIDKDGNISKTKMSGATIDKNDQKLFKQEETEKKEIVQSSTNEIVLIEKRKTIAFSEIKAGQIFKYPNSSVGNVYMKTQSHYTAINLKNGKCIEVGVDTQVDLLEHDVLIKKQI